MHKTLETTVGEQRILRFLLLAAFGCIFAVLVEKSALADDCSVAGKITVQGVPVVSGKISFHFDKDQFVGAKIRDGVYKVERVPTGKVLIVIEGQGVPAKYSSDETSGIVVMLKEGAVLKHFDLTK